MWRSLVARTVRDGEVAGSNPVTPTKKYKYSLVSEAFLLMKMLIRCTFYYYKILSA